jgi:hypothetical protein
MFGIPFVTKGKIEGMGSLVRFEKSLAKYPNGETDIAIKGVDLVNVKKYNTEHPERLYPFGNIETLEKNKISATSELLFAFDKYNDTVLKLDLHKFPKPNFYLIANSIGLSDNEKYEIIRREGDEAINRTLLNHLRLRTILASQQNSLQEYYSLN